MCQFYIKFFIDLTQSACPLCNIGCAIILIFSDE